MSAKVCSKCGTEKPISDFYKNKSKKDGLQAFCKICDNDINRAWRKENKEKVNEKNRKFRERNPHKVREYSENYKKIILSLGENLLGEVLKSLEVKFPIK